jgi:hypothetical protein
LGGRDGGKKKRRTEDKEKNNKEESNARPIKSSRNCPMRRSYVLTCPSTEPVMMLACPTWSVCTASRASSRSWIGERDWARRSQRRTVVSNEPGHAS